MENKMKCIVAEDYKPLNQLYYNLLNYEDDIEVIGTAFSGREVLELVRKEKPDVILMDIEMEEACDGIETCRCVLEMEPGIKVVMLTCHDEQNLILKAYESGAVDYVLKTDSSSVILESVRAAYRNNSPIRPYIAKVIREEIKRHGDARDTVSSVFRVLSLLTGSEMDVLRMLLDGKKQFEIAQARYVEISTVKSHVNSILKKFNKKRTSDVIKLLLESGLSDVVGR